MQNPKLVNNVSAPRRRAFQLVSRALRDYSFSGRVLGAYGHRCAFCDIQLGLVEAAHIVPVSHEASTDDTHNGVSLCALHHKAYDAALVTFNEMDSMTGHRHKQPRFPRVRLHPLKPEAALAAFMQVDPAKVEAGLRKLRRKKG